MTRAVLPPSQNFLGLDAASSAYATAKAIVLPVPYEATTSYRKGTRRGPDAILRASHQVEYWDDELDQEVCESGIASLESVETAGQAHEAALNRIGEAAAAVLDDNKFLVTLGGEHSISVPLVRAAADRYPGLSVLQLDAHSDLRDQYEGSSLNHACVMARINEMCPFVSVGLRSGILGEASSVRPDAQLIYAREMVRDARWQDRALGSLTDTVYLTFDLDFLDPSIMPAVGTPEPGGFHWYESLAFLRKVFRSRRVIACDVVELCPDPGQAHADFLAAKLVHKLIGYRFYG